MWPTFATFCRASKVATTDHARPPTTGASFCEFSESLRAITPPTCHNEAMSEPITKQKQRGRKPDASSKSGQIRTLLASGMSATDIAKKIDCTPALVYNVKARMSGGTKRPGPGRPPKQKGASAPQLDGLGAILEAVKNSERERAQLRGALERIQAVLRDVLA